MSSVDQSLNGRFPGNSQSRKGVSRRLLAPPPSRDSPSAGLPTRRVEAWHYTDLRAAMADASPILAPRSGPTSKRRVACSLSVNASLQGRKLSCLAGNSIAALSDPLPTGVFIAEGSAVAPNAVDDPLAALNEALSPAGCTIKVARGARLAEPITVVHLTH